MINIRVEESRDYDAVYAVNELAFGQEDEGRLVAALRDDPAFIPELSLVAENDGRICGHILFTRIHIVSETSRVPVIALAPMAVLPEMQRRGIGSQLVTSGLERARLLEQRAVIVLGHPDYYPRFGFVPASRWDIRCPFPAPDEAFLGLELVPGVLKNCAGEVEYSRAFWEL